MVAVPAASPPENTEHSALNSARLASCYHRSAQNMCTTCVLLSSFAKLKVCLAHCADTV